MANSEIFVEQPCTALAPASPESPGGAGAVIGPAPSFVRDLLSLTKPRITTLVLLTGASGACLAPGRAGVSKLLLSMAGTVLIVASANVLNMWWERETDAKMRRTRDRPLPAGRMSPDVALAFGLALGLAAAPLLLLVNLMTALLGLAALVTYVAVYTPLKRHTHLALLVGAVPGAMPPLLGWTTVTERIGLGGLLLFGLLFLWQLPHFAAITIFRGEDYARAGLQVISVQLGEKAARQSVAFWTVLLVLTSLLFVPFGLAGKVYLGAATILGGLFLVLAFRGLRAGPRLDTRRWARWVFVYSLPYLSLLLLALLANRA